MICNFRAKYLNVDNDINVIQLLSDMEPQVKWLAKGVAKWIAKWLAKWLARRLSYTICGMGMHQIQMLQLQNLWCVCSSSEYFAVVLVQIEAVLFPKHKSRMCDYECRASLYTVVTVIVIKKL